MFNAEQSSYTARVFLNFPTEGTVVALKVIGGNKSPAKFYKVTVSGAGAISIFESLSRSPSPSSSPTEQGTSGFSQGLLVGSDGGGARRHEETLKASTNR